MMLIGRVINHVDARVMVLFGIAMCTISMYQMAHISLAMDANIIIVSGLIQGVGTACIFTPLTTMVFTTLKPHLRNDGSALFTLIRNFGSSVGISVLSVLSVRNASTVHSRLVEGVRPDNPVMDLRAPGFDFTLPSSVAAMNGEVTRQAMMVSYADAFWFLTLIGFFIAPMLLFVRPGAMRRGGPKEPAVHMD